MRIGFHLLWRHHENIQLCFRLAKLFRNFGFEISFLSPGHKIPCVDPVWDKYVQSEEKTGFKNWVQFCSHVIWPEALNHKYLICAKQFGAKTTLLGLLDWVHSSYAKAYAAADVVVCPSRQGVDLFRENWKLTNTIYVPWDAGIPLTRKFPSSGSTTILVPMHGTQSARIDPELVNVVHRVLVKFPGVQIVLLYSRRCWNSIGMKAVKRLKNIYGSNGQLRAYSDSEFTPDQLLRIYAACDLTIWPTEIDATGAIALESLSMGTPVMGYDIAPINEIIHDGKNGILVPCQISYNKFGVPMARSAPKEFEKRLVDAIQNKDEVDEMKTFTRLGMAIRKDKFVTNWRNILNV